MDRSLRMTEQLNAKKTKEEGKPVRKRRPAAVLVPLCTVDNEPAILFTLRSATLSSHAGQISFPGGHADCVDEEREDPVVTAIRETKEEPRETEKQGVTLGWFRRATVRSLSFC